MIKSKIEEKGGNEGVNKTIEYHNKKQTRKILVNQSLLKKIVNELLAVLKKRQREVIVRRFGLEKKRPEVLNQIGKDLGITRERVRQIERDVFKKLQKIKKSENFQLLEEKALTVLEEEGGFCEKSLLKEKIFPNLTQKDRNRLMFIFNSSPLLHFRKGSRQISGFWMKKGEEKELEKEIDFLHNFIFQIIQSQNRPLFFEEIKAILENDEQGRKILQQEQGERKLRIVLLASQLLERNILEEWGLKKWRTISQRGSRDKAYLVLRKVKEPLHFRQIAEMINYFWKDKKALSQTVHNELIKDHRFVLVGRGTYGLREWGLKEGTVRNLIVDILKRKKRPMGKEEIIKHILSIKKVKETTIMVNLSDKSLFLKTGEGKFYLKE